MGGGGEDIEVGINCVCLRVEPFFSVTYSILYINQKVLLKYPAVFLAF